MIYDDIRNFNKQFEYELRVENAAKLKKFKKFLVVGMGGSHLAADLLKAWRPDFDIIVWSSYGLPPLRDIRERLVIACSYSGKTEETIDSFNEAKRRRLSVAAVAAGGKLIGLARKYRAPYVEMPDMHMQPRLALGLMLKSFLKLMGENTALKEANELAITLRPSRHEAAGKAMAKRLYGSVPIIYSSLRNQAIAANWKVKLNETGKTPAFYNVLSEMNHNEMTGFDVKPRMEGLSRHFHFVFLKDAEDDIRIMRRMNIMEKLFHDRGLKVEVIFLQGKTALQKIFNAVNLADWTAYYTAKLYGVDPEAVPMVEEFKRLVARKQL
jgi:glucose/mannose-6-phosphate isomerase